MPLNRPNDLLGDDFRRGHEDLVNPLFRAILACGVTDRDIVNEPDKHLSPETPSIILNNDYRTKPLLATNFDCQISILRARAGRFRGELRQQTEKDMQSVGNFWRLDQRQRARRAEKALRYRPGASNTARLSKNSVKSSAAASRPNTAGQYSSGHSRAPNAMTSVTNYWQQTSVQSDCIVCKYSVDLGSSSVAIDRIRLDCGCYYHQNCMLVYADSYPNDNIKPFTHRVNGKLCPNASSTAGESIQFITNSVIITTILLLCRNDGVY